MKNTKISSATRSIGPKIHFFHCFLFIALFRYIIVSLPPLSRRTHNFNSFRSCFRCWFESLQWAYPVFIVFGGQLSHHMKSSTRSQHSNRRKWISIHCDVPSFEWRKNIKMKITSTFGGLDMRAPNSIHVPTFPYLQLRRRRRRIETNSLSHVYRSQLKY